LRVGRIIVADATAAGQRFDLIAALGQRNTLRRNRAGPERFGRAGRDAALRGREQALRTVGHVSINHPVVVTGRFGSGRVK